MNRYSIYPTSFYLEFQYWEELNRREETNRTEVKTNQEQGQGEWLEEEVAGSPWPLPQLSQTPIAKKCTWRTQKIQSNSECYTNTINAITLQFKNHLHISYLKRKKSTHKVSVSSELICCCFWSTGCLESFIKTRCYRDNDVIRKSDFW